MPESSIVIFADGPSQGRYRDIGIEKESLNIFACVDADDILEMLKANVVLIDCGIGVKKGLKLLKKIKARHPQIPVIFLTDASSEETAIAAFRSGARDYFANPVNRQVLRKTIKRLVDIRKKTAEMRQPFIPISDVDRQLAADLATRVLPSRLREILTYMEENLAGKITLSSLARQSRMSKYHFSHYFRKHTGQSPMKYVNSFRIQHAKVLLSRSDLTITEIAHQVGYDDLGALVRNFKKVTGGTPTEFRKGPGRNHCGLI